MENNKNQKSDKLVNTLGSSDLKTARAAIKKIRTAGKLEDIPNIIAALKNQEKEEIRKELHGLLCDIQLTGFQTHIVDAIKDPDNEDILSDLLSVCWENKQDFSAFLDVFVNSFLKSDYKASIEAFTMIEKVFMDYDYTQEKLMGTMDVIKSTYPDLPENKRELALVLLESLDTLKA